MNDSELSALGVTRDKGRGGQDRVLVRNDLAEAEIYLHGATVTHYQPTGHAPVLFVSSNAIFDGAKPIRGGVPICWPWFGPHPTDLSQPQHGTVRTKAWTLTYAERQPDGATRLSFSVETHEVEVTYLVTVGRSLTTTLIAANRSTMPLNITEALHSYLAVGDLRQISVEGLAGVDYIDRVAHNRDQQPAGAIRFNGEFDRTFLNTVTPVTVIDPMWKRRLIISKQGSKSTVVWNPGAEKITTFKDLAADQWPMFVCVETANASDNVVTVAPGTSHVMEAEISVVG